METNFITELQKVRKIVKEVLTNYRKTRDDNKLLIFYVYKQIIEQTANIITDTVCLNLNTIEILPSPETITRTARILQNKHVNLRGEKYAERKKYAKKISKEIKNIY